MVQRSSLSDPQQQLQQLFFGHRRQRFPSERLGALPVTARYSTEAPAYAAPALHSGDLASAIMERREMVGGYDSPHGLAYNDTYVPGLSRSKS